MDSPQEAQLSINSLHNQKLLGSTANLIIRFADTAPIKAKKHAKQAALPPSYRFSPYNPPPPTLAPTLGGVKYPEPSPAATLAPKSTVMHPNPVNNPFSSALLPLDVSTNLHADMQAMAISTGGRPQVPGSLHTGIHAHTSMVHPTAHAQLMPAWPGTPGMPPHLMPPRLMVFSSTAPMQQQSYSGQCYL
jgi:hypothetical protein